MQSKLFNTILVASIKLQYIRILLNLQLRCDDVGIKLASFIALFGYTVCKNDSTFPKIALFKLSLKLPSTNHFKLQFIKCKESKGIN
jgi:hypothetical protein